MDERIFDYLKEAVARGASIEEAKKALLEGGFSREEIDLAASSLFGAGDVSTDLSTSTPQDGVVWEAETKDKKSWVWVGIGAFVFVLIIVFGIVFVFSGEEVVEVSGEDVSTGKVFEFSENSKFLIDSDEGEVEIEASSVDDSSVRLIKEGSFNLVVSEGEAKELDIDGDGEYDLIVELEALRAGGFNFVFREFEKLREGGLEEFNHRTSNETDSFSGGAINNTSSAENLGETEGDVNESISDETESEDTPDEVDSYNLRQDCGIIGDLSEFPEIKEVINLSGGSIQTITVNDCSLDDASICMGHNLLACSEGKVSFDLDEGSGYFEVLEKRDDVCLVGANMSDKYIRCEFASEEMAQIPCMGSECSFAGVPCHVSTGVLSSMFLASVFEFDECEVVDALTGEKKVVETSCDSFSSMLDSCTPFVCQYEHPLMGGIMEKEIIGTIDGLCVVGEEMPNNGEMKCSYNNSQRERMVDYLIVYEDECLNGACSIVLNSTGYFINDILVENVLQEMTDGGDCVISGYD